jgi:cytochrome c biogenesis protein CcdA
MELITILNRCHRFRGFVYQQARFSVDKKSIEVAERPRKGSAALCSPAICRRPDTTNSRSDVLSSFLCGDFSSFCSTPCVASIAAGAAASSLKKSPWAMASVR